jgi:hypothetical protein
MLDTELNEIWKQYDRRLEQARILNLQSWVLNLQHFETVQKQKVRGKLNGLAWQKLILVIIGIFYSFALFVLIANSLNWSKIFFIISAAAVAATTSIAVIVYIRQLVLIRQVNNAETILAAQEKIAKLQTGTLNITRILFLQAPFYCTWYLSPAMIKANPYQVLFFTLPAFILLGWLSVFLYRNINYKNMQKKWFKILFSSPEWTSLIKSEAFLNEIDDYKKSIVIK